MFSYSTHLKTKMCDRFQE